MAREPSASHGSADRSLASRRAEDRVVAINGARLAGSLVSVAEEPPEIQGDGKIEATYFLVEPNREQLVDLARLADSGDLRPAIDSVFPLSDARSAFQRSMERGKRGKVVLRVAEEATG